MNFRLILFLLLSIRIELLAGDDLPIVPEGFVVDVVAREPLVSNPCVLAFDRWGRICVAQGPQWRGPTPDTPGDRVDILTDTNGDGISDQRKTFAEGFNSIQGLAWHGDDLWVANAPDLTVVRDTDNDDEADVYIRVYTGLGNLEHSLHGLNFGPDRKLYMSKGNSKGYNRLDQLAPKVFRELWGLPSPEGAPDYTPVEYFTKQTYRRQYHTPQDDWGQQGGILRCDPYQDGKPSGKGLEIVSRGFRNPWDITFDDGFHWLGTDNDQTQGDKIFAPFYGAHLGWGHPWSFHWTGAGHLPTVPASAPLFEGSGAGVIHYHADQFPAEYQGVFFINDWMRREVYTFRPRWDGALMKCKGDFPPVFAHAEGGRSLPASSGRMFEPTDIEVGPDGAIYILSWGHAYGATIKDGQQVDAGRVYRIRYAGNPLKDWQHDLRRKPQGQWTLDQLFQDLASDVPAWRVNAQTELLRRGEPAQKYLFSRLNQGELSTASQTWALWTLGASTAEVNLDQYLSGILADSEATRNARIQALRILTHRIRQFEQCTTLPDAVLPLLTSEDARLRHAAVQAIWQAEQKQWIHDLLQVAADETDRVVFFSTWNTLRGLASLQERTTWLEDPRAGVRLATLLGLFHDGSINGAAALAFRNDEDSRIVKLVNDWLEKTGQASPLVQFDPPPGEYSRAVNVKAQSTIAGAFLTYTLDGSLPTHTSQRVKGPISIDHTSQLRVAVNQGNNGSSQAVTAEYEIRHVPAYRHREFVSEVQTPSGRYYELDWTGLDVGKRHYTDRNYYITQVPDELDGLPFLRTANGDDRSTGAEWLSLVTTEDCDLIVGTDLRNPDELEWMKIGQPGGFEDTGLKLTTTDPVFRLYRKHFPAGRVVLGGNTNQPKTDSGRGNYLVIFQRQILSPAEKSQTATSDRVLSQMQTADPERGRELFLHPQGAGCFKCHRMEGIGGVLAPDLSDIGSRAREPGVLIESILEPSKVITEGFALQQIVTVEGRVISGAVLEETQQSLKLVGTDGVIQTIAVAEIEERIGTRVSPMPNGFGKMLNAQQIADIVAWLLTQRKVGDRDGFSFREHNDRLEIFFKAQQIATYLKQHPRLTRRALVNLRTPEGIQVTRNFPPRRPEDIDPGYQAEDGIIHPVMHPGLWIGFGDVNGNDYWRLQAQVQFNGYVEPPAGSRGTGSFAVSNLFLSEDRQDVVCNEITRYRFERTPDGLILRIDAEYQSDKHDFYFGDQEESGLAVRVASPLRVQGGSGTILNDRGERNGAQVWGKEARWFDYVGTVQGREVGVMVLPDPGNPRPSWLHARDYGVVVFNPFPKQPRERREPYVKTSIKRGETFRLSYAILIHDRPAGQPLDHGQAAKLLLQSFK